MNTHAQPPAAPGAVRRWRPAPVVWLSFAWHVLAATAVMLQPGLWPWALGAVAANHLLLTVAVLFPRSAALGRNLVRLPASARARNEVSLTFDDGPDPDVTPRVLDILDAHGAKASFFAVGAKAAACPDLMREIVRRGHSVENHSHHHAWAFSFFGLARLRREVEGAQSAITDAAGRPPRYFRAPAGFRSVLLDPVLARCGLSYASWTRRGYDAWDGNARRVSRRLIHRLTAGDVLVLHDGGCARALSGEPVVLAVLPVVLERLSQQGLKSVALPEPRAEDGPAF